MFTGKKMELLIGVAAIAALAYWRNLKMFSKQYKVKLIGATFNKNKSIESGFSRLYITPRIEVTNPTAFTGTLESADIIIFYKEKQTARIHTNANLTIAKKDKTVLEIPVEINTLKMAADIQDIINEVTSSTPIVINVRGTLNFQAGQYTVNENVKIL